MKLLSILFFFLSFHVNAKVELSFLHDASISSDYVYNGKLFGGLSGITNIHNDLYAAISDDRGKYGVPRYYILHIVEKSGIFTVTPKNWVEIKDENSKTFADGDVDFEGITKLNNGNLLISSEGDPRREIKIAPKISEYTLTGKFVRNWDIPDKFLPSKTKGVRYNLSLESLGSTKDGVFQFTTSEEPLIQDGDELTHASGLVRILRFKNGLVDGEFAYRASAFPRKSKKDKGNNGVVDLLPLSATKILVLERAYNQSDNKNVIKIFEVDISKAQDLTGFSELKNKKVKEATKIEVMDLGPLASKLSGDTKRLDNIEGIAFGPKLSSGEDSIILVSDNNFSKNQRTLFIFLKFKDLN